MGVYVWCAYSTMESWNNHNIRFENQTNMKLIWKEESIDDLNE